MKNYYQYLFHYNSYTGLWAAFKSREQKQYMEKMYPHPGSKAIFSPSIKHLLKAIAAGNSPKTKEKTVYQDYGLGPL